MKEMMTLSPVTGEKLEDMEQRIEDLLNYMEEVDQSGYYPQLTVVRSWSEHNPGFPANLPNPGCFPGI